MWLCQARTSHRAPPWSPRRWTAVTVCLNVTGLTTCHHRRRRAQVRKAASGGEDSGYGHPLEGPVRESGSSSAADLPAADSIYRWGTGIQG